MSQKAFSKRLKGLKVKISNTKDRIATVSIENITLGEIEVVLNLLKEHKQKLDEVYDGLIDECEDDEFDDYQEIFTVLYNALTNAESKALEFQRVKTRNETLPVANSSAPAHAYSFKLDNIRLPQFSGKQSDWLSFHDLFVTSVHNNVSLSGAEKLIHLKSVLTGDALHVVASYPATDNNYLQAWSTLLSRYNNNREIIFSLIKDFVHLKGMKEESASGLRHLSDSLNECIRSLRVLNVPVDHWDLIMIFHGLEKLDTNTRREWSLTKTGDLPTLVEFIDFLEVRARALLEVSTLNRSQPAQSSNSNSQSSKGRSSVHHSSTNKLSCAKCNEAHVLSKCKSFKSLVTRDRKEFVFKNRICFNCLGKGHTLADCPDKQMCKTCGKKHNSLLHFEKRPELPLSESNTAESPEQAGPSTSQTLSSHSTASSKLVLLGTIVASCVSAQGVKMDCRVFLDPGSESNFISEHCVSRLGLARKKTCVKVIGIGGTSSNSATGIVEVTLHSKLNLYKLNLSALVLKKITMDLPSAECKSQFQHIKGLPLADPYFFRPGKIDILLGAQAAGLIMLPGLKIGSLGSPTAQNTQFGWFLSGAVDSSSVMEKKVYSHHSQCRASDACIETSLNKFWEIEEAEFDSHTSKEDEECEAHFIRTHVRNQDGTYTVDLPFKSDYISSDTYGLGKSRELAVKRFLRVEQRLSSTPEIKAEYVASINESLALGFMEKVPVEELNKPHYYMPHREVVKESSHTTKVRIVYDASSKSSNSLSLNDVLMTGPKLQVDLVSLLIRFRSHRIVLIADIQKFYNQFYVNKAHTDYQRLIWRESSELPLEDYRFNRVTFGVTSAPYLAIRCLHQLAEDEVLTSSHLKDVLKEDFLVDNLLTGAPDVETALELQKGLLAVMSKGKLKLRQWSSNCEEVLLSVPQEDRELSSCLTISEGDIVKTIGIQWFPKSDSFGVKISPLATSPITKRSVLSLIARIFDPLGWLTPFTVKFKILMQNLWKDELPWDSELSTQHQKMFTKYCHELNDLVGYKIPRCIVPLDMVDCRYELHGFCDASEDAYAACVYLRTIFSSNESETKLICSKSKVAPLKQITIPRLELCGALLLAKLMKTVSLTLKISISLKRAWTDSTIVIGWLASDKKLPVFESNRVRKIVEIIPSQFWFHVAGIDNPADCASRGVTAQQFIGNELWLNGPPWLYSYKSEEVELSTAMSAQVESNSVLLYINKCSSFNRMQRVIAYCFRFRNNCCSSVKQTGALTLAELNKAHLAILISVQKEVFVDEFLSNNLSRSKYKSLSPFVDTDGLLKVGGRLEKSQIEGKHPILLPKNHHLTEVIIRFFHQDNLHCGPRLLLALLRQKYWIIRGIDVAKSCVRACMACFKQSSKTLTQQMGQLPRVRVTPARPFSNTGVDYAGPFIVNLRTGRKPPQQKSYVALFVCMCTKAIHLELVSDLSTQAFLAALSRFTARRGLPSNIYCDGGKNFVGAANEIKLVQSLLSSDVHQNLVSQLMAEKSVKFHFNPPLAPHHGGLWEAGVKSMKFHVKRVVGEAILTVEEFTTLLARIESCLNSRPLTQLSNDPNEFKALTPSHFLIGSNAQCVPESDLTHLKVNSLTRWQLVQQLFQHIWKRWSVEYLNTLQQHHKWNSSQPNIVIGQLVHLHEDHVGWGPLNWKLARVLNVYPGSDGKVRVVELKTSTGSVLRRPITRLAPLPIVGNHEL